MKKELAEKIFKEIYESEVLNKNYAPATTDWERLQLKYLGEIKFPMKTLDGRHWWK